MRQRIGPIAPEASDRKARQSMKTPRHLKKRRLRRFVGWVFSGLTLLVMLVGLSFVVLRERHVELPGWASAKLANQLTQAMAPLAVNVETTEIFVSESGTPTVTLLGVRVRDPKGRQLAYLPALDASFAGASLLRGQLRLRELALRETRVILRRDPSGAIDIGLGLAPQGGTQNGDILKALEQFDNIFTYPALEQLQGISVEGLALSYDDARARRHWEVRDGLLTFEQTPEDVRLQVFFALKNDAGVPSEMALSYVSRKGSPQARFAASFSDVSAGDIATQSPALAFLSVIDAPISGAVRTGITQDGTLAPLSAALELGAGAVRPMADVAPIRFSHAKSYFQYDPTQERLSFDEIAVDTQGVRLQAEGHAYLRDQVAGWPRSLVTQLRFSQVLLDPEGVFEKPAAFTSGALDMKLSLDPFSARIGQLVLIDDTGVAYRGHGRADVTPAGWEVDVDLSLAEITKPRLLALWPLTAVPKTRRWLEENILAGRMTDANAAIRFRPDARPVASLSFDFHDARARFVKTLPPIEQGMGYASISDNGFTLTLEQGHIAMPSGGKIVLDGSIMQVPDLEVKPTPGAFTLQSDSALGDMLALLDMAPLKILSRAGRSPDLAQGRVRALTTLELPLIKHLKLEQVDYNVEATLRDVESTTLIADRTLRAKQLMLRADDQEVAITGTAAIDGVGFTGSWRQAMGPENRGRSKVTGTLELSQRFADAFGLGLPPGSLRERGRGALEIQLIRDQAPQFSLRSDLAGLGLRISDLNWSKSPRSTGQLRLAGVLSDPPRIDTLVFSAPGLSARGALSFRPGGGLAQARFSQVDLGGWLSAPVLLRGQGKGRPPTVSVEGGMIDLRKLPEGRQGGGSGGGGAGSAISLALDRLVVTDGITLRGVRGNLERRGGLNGRFNARVNGGAPVQITLAPAKGGTAVRVLSEDAGGVLRAAGIFEKSRGGTMDLVLSPRGAPGDYNGTLNIRRTRVKGAPVLAELLSAISVVGILELLDGEGLVFSDVQSVFRLTPGALEIKRGSAVGPSLGISLAGIYDLRRNRMDMQGVISPIYMLNGIGSIFSRRGEGLFGFNYSLSGPAKEPRVRVNPLSILTPGRFREIFRAPPPELKP